jgi:hypothetical protein
VYRSDVGVGRTPPGGGGEAGKELLFGGISGGARSGLPKSVGAGAPAAEEIGTAGGGEAGNELLSGGRDIPGGARSGLPGSVGAGAPGAEDGRAVGGGGTPPKGAGKATEGLSGLSGGPCGCASWCACALNARKVAMSVVGRGNIIIGW